MSVFSFGRAMCLSQRSGRLRTANSLTLVSDLSPLDGEGRKPTTAPGSLKETQSMTTGNVAPFDRARNLPKPHTSRPISFAPDDLRDPSTHPSLLRDPRATDLACFDPLAFLADHADDPAPEIKGGYDCTRTAGRFFPPAKGPNMGEVFSRLGPHTLQHGEQIGIDPYLSTMRANLKNVQNAAGRRHAKLSLDVVTALHMHGGIEWLRTRPEVVGYIAARKRYDDHNKGIPRAIRDELVSILGWRKLDLPPGTSVKARWNTYVPSHVDEWFGALRGALAGTSIAPPVAPLAALVILPVLANLTECDDCDVDGYRKCVLDFLERIEIQTVIADSAMDSYPQWFPPREAAS